MHASIRKLPLFAAAALLFAATVPVLAQQVPGRPSPERGEELARKLCANCHIPAEGQPRMQGTADVPTFPEIARRQTADGIKAALIMPGHPMPQIQLTRAEMDDLAAYILSLRESD